MTYRDPSAAGRNRSIVHLIERADTIRAKADAAADELASLEAEIFATPPESLEEAAALARFIARMAERDEEVPADQLAAASRAIAALLEAEATHEADEAEDDEAADIGSMLHRMRAFDRTIAYRTEDAKHGKPRRITVVGEGETFAPVLDHADRLAREEARRKVRWISAA